MLFFMKRLMAQIIDLFLALLIIFVTFGFVAPFLAKFIPNVALRGVLCTILMFGSYFLIQYPFMQNAQTIGKGFYGIKIASTDKFRKDVPAAVVFQREVLCKLMSCYFICLPLLFGKRGGHEEATHTKLVKA